MIVKEKSYKFGKDTIIVQTRSLSEGCSDEWRLIVNNEEGDWSSFYNRIYIFKDYYLVSPYYDGTFYAYVPFKLEYAKELHPEIQYS